mgnify:CR=1 FL=1
MADNTPRNTLWIIIILILILGAFLWAYPKLFNQPIVSNNESNNNQADSNEQNNELAQVKSVVENFGQQIKNVSLLNPNASQLIDQYYKDYVSQDLLNQWKANPANALGRQTSSPWPDRIDVTNVQRTANDTYTVEGNIIEVTSQEQANGGAAATRPATFTVKNIEGRWLITQISTASYQ